MFRSLTLAFLLGAQSVVVQNYKLDIFHYGVWVGDSVTKVEQTELRGQKVIKSYRKTQLTRASGRIKPSFSEVTQYQDLEGNFIELRYTFSTGLEVQEMRVTWGKERVHVERWGLGPQGAYEPSSEDIDKEKAKSVGGSPLDSLLLGGAGKKSNVNLSLNLQSKKLEETEMEFKGDATILSGSARREALEYHIVRGKAVLYKVFLDDRTLLPLRIESIDGLVMLPAKAPSL